MMGRELLKVEKGTSVDRFPGGRAAPTRQSALWVHSFQPEEIITVPQSRKRIYEGCRGLSGPNNDFQNERR